MKLKINTLKAILLFLLTEGSTFSSTNISEYLSKNSRRLEELIRIKWSETTKTVQQHSALNFLSHEELPPLHFMGMSNTSISETIVKEIGVKGLILKRERGLFLQDKKDTNVLYRYYIDEVPICLYQVRMVNRKKWGTAVIGRFPIINREQNHPINSEENWTDLNISLERSLKNLLENIRSDISEIHSEELIQKEKCYFVEDEVLYPTWRLKVRINGHWDYQIYANEERVWHWEPMFFDFAEDTTTGKIAAYRYNKIDSSEIEQFDIALRGTGYLENQYFETDTDSSPAYGTKRAYSETHQFIYNETDARFDEASAFLHANQMLGYLLENGFKWEEEAPTLIIVHAVLGGNRNNAQYKPKDQTGTSQAQILIGDGDGKGLQNLAKDADVIFHELSHSVAYKTMTGISGESAVLHEAVSDFLTFAFTDNTCLGETICPKDSVMCAYHEGTCLRKAMEDLIYDSEDYKKMAYHLRGQMISGLLWAVRDTMADKKDATRLLIKSVEYLIANSGFRDFLHSLLLADVDLFEGKNACTIYEKAELLGLTTFLAGISCEDNSTFLTPGSQAMTDPPKVLPDPQQGEDANSSNDNGLFGCGSIPNAGSPISTMSLLAFILLFCAPLAFVFRVK